jgi:predicted anti-sigma-YlaC factor YlaD
MMASDSHRIPPYTSAALIMGTAWTNTCTTWRVALSVAMMRSARNPRTQSMLTNVVALTITAATCIKVVKKSIQFQPLRK